jgi:hypothetical protein
MIISKKRPIVEDRNYIFESGVKDKCKVPLVSMYHGKKPVKVKFHAVLSLASDGGKR